MLGVGLILLLLGCVVGRSACGPRLPQRPGFWARLVDGVAISRASSTIFATVGTALVSLLVIPVLEIVYSLLFGADLHSTQLLRTAYVAPCVSFTSAICSGMVSRVATDRHLGRP